MTFVLLVGGIVVGDGLTVVLFGKCKKVGVQHHAGLGVLLANEIA